MPDDSPIADAFQGPLEGALWRTVWPFAVLTLILLAAAAAAVGVVCCRGGDPPAATNLLLLASGALGTGSLLGFIYGTFGQDESARFSPVFTAVAAALTGAVAVDLVRPDSGLARAGDQLGQKCGLGEGAGGLVLFVVAAFFSPGFMLLFVYKALLINLPVSDINKRIRVLEASYKALLGADPFPKPDLVAGDVSRPSAPPPGAAAAAAAIAGRAGAGEEGGAAKLRADAMAFAARGDLDKAEHALKAAIAKDGSDAQSKYDLARILLRPGASREEEAIPLLRGVVSSTDAPAAAWMLLGYAGLWGGVEDLKEAEAASKKYMELRPEDPGAWLNLACAYAQLAGKAPEPQRPEYRTKALETLRALLSKHPLRKQRVIELAGERDGDFAALRDDPEFQALIS